MSDNSSSGTSLPFGPSCIFFEPHFSIFAAYTATNFVLLLPLCVLVLVRGFHRRQRCRCSSTAATMNHSDSFTYHLATMELMLVLGCVLCCCGSNRKDIYMLTVGYCLSSVTWYGETLFHILVCVEHYLAVVHPITYLSLRTERWIRIRNVFIGCVWLLSSGGIFLSARGKTSLIVLFCLLFVSVIITSFCSLSVLCVLIRPGPGGRGVRDQVRVDQAKRRAFNTIAAILAVLLLRCTWNMVWGALYVRKDGLDECLVNSVAVWFTLPSGLVLPLVFLQK